ncbi:MAG: ABC transporter substrate-binding protein, partial [Desulfofustis sp.]|nr:ABC transporter substrate-binding protein [Desulfofustis sp.]
MMRTLYASLVCLLLAVAPAGAEEVIKLGALFDLSGRAAFIGTPTKLVAEMVVEKINAEGGIDGKKIELVIADTEADPAKTASIVKKFIY